MQENKELSTNSFTPHPPFCTNNIKMDRIPTKIKRKIHALFTLFQVLKVPLIKICKIQHSHHIFYFLLFLLNFTSADIIFHKFLELHSTFSEKKISVMNFPFLTDSLKPSHHPLNSQNLPS